MIHPGETPTQAADPVGVRHERVRGKLDGRVEDHSYVLKRCLFSAFMSDMVRKGFWLAQGEGRQVEPSRLLLEETHLWACGRNGN